MPGMGPNNIRLELRTRVTCPHCWASFAPEDTRWVAVHPDLQRDPRVDPGGLRFLPTRFNVEGNAIDPRGQVCQELACPSCHLRVPRPLFEMAPLFASIAGTPSCGKTYFLASMTWRLRHSLPKCFAMTFSDADPVSNLLLNEYENQQFFNPVPDALVKLAKTQEHGDLYDTVMYGEQLVEYPRPFLFAIRPSANHPNYAQSSRVSRLLCLYDNAGESFEPGKDDVSAPVTRHLAQAQVIMFCFDPTQDPRLRKECQARTTDPQVVTALETRRQEAVFHELVDRVRRHAGLHQNQKHSRPLVIIVTKFDVWWPLIGDRDLPSPWTEVTNVLSPHSTCRSWNRSRTKYVRCCGNSRPRWFRPRRRFQTTSFTCRSVQLAAALNSMPRLGAFSAFGQGISIRFGQKSLCYLRLLVGAEG